VDQSRVNPIIGETVVHGMISEEPLSDYFDIESACRLSDLTTGKYRPIYFPQSTRVAHIDLAINHDAAGIVMGCLGNPVVQSIQTDIRKIQLPEYTVWIDFFMRIMAPSGSKIHFSAIRQLMLWLHQTCGYQIGLLSWDGFESEDSVQIMERRGYKVTKLSIDRTLGPYSTLRDVIHYQRLLMPNHELVKTELKHLEKAKRRHRKTEMVDHPKTMRFGSKLLPGSKDVADSLAGTTHHLVTSFAATHVVGTPEEIAPPVGPKKTEKSLAAALQKENRPTMRELVLKGGKK